MQKQNLQTLKGFRDYRPEAMIPRERLIDTARRVYRSYGFSPIDTPALEYLEILADILVYMIGLNKMPVAHLCRKPFHYYKKLHHLNLKMMDNHTCMSLDSESNLEDKE